MRDSLKIYPGSECDAVTAIAVDVSRVGALLALRYVVSGAIDDVRWPRAAPSARTDNLWQHTCFEAFIGSTGSPEYYEFNFSPSTEWAAYKFARYREDMAIVEEIGAPEITVGKDDARFELSASLALDAASLPQGPWRIGLSAVIEETNGRKSYWALAHPAAKPDFHHSDSFIFELPA
jgi:hypothetical protein